MVLNRDERPASAAASGDTKVKPIALQTHEGIDPHPVQPSPVFHGRQIAVMEGFVDIDEIRLWRDNERLTIHVNQFKQAHGREPDPDELVSIMQSTANLPGLDANDQFRIRDLARSIAANGIRTPPVIAHDGTLLDGNRRVAACRHIIENEGFSTEQKSRASKIRVWQLTESAVQSDEYTVVISLNFEPDHKQEWPEYVKARKVYEAWRAALEVEVNPSASRQTIMKRDMANQFAMTVSRLNRYIEMVKIADDFEDYQRVDRDRDEYEVKHKSERYFQYFDEMGKGRTAGGVNYTMAQDDPFKHLVFDLTYDGKFKNFTQIRELRHAYNNEEAMDLLREARGARDREQGSELVDNALSVSRAARAVERRVGGNKRVEGFVNWLLQAPVSFFSIGEAGAITRENMQRLYRALKLVEGHIPDDLRREADERS